MLTLQLNIGYLSMNRHCPKLLWADVKISGTRSLRVVPMKAGHHPQSWVHFVKLHAIAGIKAGLDAQIFRMILNMDIGVRCVVGNLMIKLQFNCIPSQARSKEFGGEFFDPTVKLKETAEIKN